VWGARTRTSTLTWASSGSLVVVDEAARTGQRLVHSWKRSATDSSRQGDPSWRLPGVVVRCGAGIVGEDRPRVAVTEDQHPGDIDPGGEHKSSRAGECGAGPCGFGAAAGGPVPSQASIQMNALVIGLRGRCPCLSVVSAAQAPARTDIWRTGTAAKITVNRICAGQWHIAASGQVVCKTVGLAYVGSNPTPATTSGNSP
jgi:hypothetical protein